MQADGDPLADFLWLRSLRQSLPSDIVRCPINPLHHIPSTHVVSHMVEVHMEDDLSHAAEAMYGAHTAARREAFLTELSGRDGERPTTGAVPASHRMDEVADVEPPRRRRHRTSPRALSIDARRPHAYRGDRPGGDETAGPPCGGEMETAAVMGLDHGDAMEEGTTRGSRNTRRTPGHAAMLPKGSPSASEWDSHHHHHRSIPASRPHAVPEKTTDGGDREGHDGVVPGAPQASSAAAAAERTVLGRYTQYGVGALRSTPPPPLSPTTPEEKDGMPPHAGSMHRYRAGQLQRQQMVVVADVLQEGEPQLPKLDSLALQRFLEQYGGVQTLTVDTTQRQFEVCFTTTAAARRCVEKCTPAAIMDDILLVVQRVSTPAPQTYDQEKDGVKAGDDDDDVNDDDVIEDDSNAFAAHPLPVVEGGLQDVVLHPSYPVDPASPVAQLPFSTMSAASTGGQSSASGADAGLPPFTASAMVNSHGTSNLTGNNTQEKMVENTSEEGIEEEDLGEIDHGTGGRLKGNTRTVSPPGREAGTVEKDGDPISSGMITLAVDSKWGRKQKDGSERDCGVGDEVGLSTVDRLKRVAWDLCAPFGGIERITCAGPRVVVLFHEPESAEKMKQGFCPTPVFASIF